MWSIALEGKSDLDRFKALNRGLRAWDLWNWNDCDKRFGDDWPARHRERSGEAGGPGRIPAQMIAHILYYFSDQNDLVFDPTRPPRLKAEPMEGRWLAVEWWLTPVWPVRLTPLGRRAGV